MRCWSNPGEAGLGCHRVLDTRTTGRLLSHFLKEKRLGKAARLLKGGNLRVSQIARRCGFDSENYFRQQFRERFGMSPRQFRSNGKLSSVRRATA